jgi:hypothetical protein
LFLEAGCELFFGHITVEDREPPEHESVVEKSEDPRDVAWVHDSKSFIR